MKKKGTIILLVVLVLGAVAAYVYFGVLYKENRNISQEEAAAALPAKTLIDAYTANQQSADSLYLNKTRSRRDCYKSRRLCANRRRACVLQF